MALQRAYKFPDSVQRRLNIGERVRKREPQITFTVITKGSAGQSRHTGLVQKTIRKFVTRKTDTTDIREKIKRSERLQTMNARNTVETVGENVSPLSELCNHLQSGFFCLRRKSLECRALRERGGARDTVV